MCGGMIYKHLTDGRKYIRPFSHPTSFNLFKNQKYYIHTDLNLKDQFFRNLNGYEIQVMVGTYKPSLSPYADVC